MPEDTLTQNLTMKFTISIFLLSIALIGCSSNSHDTVINSDTSKVEKAPVAIDTNFDKSTKAKEDKSSESMTSLGVFTTKRTDSIFKKLVGSSYSQFVNSTQLTSEDDDLDGLNSTVYSSGVKGLYTIMENIIMIDSLNNIWAAVIDDNKVYYFTNTQNHKSTLPKTIDNWRQRFKDYPIIYK